LFKTLASVNIVQIPYKGNGPGLTASVAGETQLMFPNAGAVTPYLKSGRLIALAVTSAKPTRLAPGLPTVAQTVPGYEAQATFGVFAPAKTPAAIVRRLNKEIVEVLNTPAVKERFFRSGVEVVGSSQTELSAKINSEMSTLGKVIKKAGIRVN
jgi:tripartite-type tricarboxylate transporter receptor subunit TctC